MRPIKTIVVHCSATHEDMDIGVEEIRKWHVDERGWTDIGYHFVVRRDGKVESGRPLSRPGAHVKGNNSDSIGICWVGGVSKANGRPQDNRSAEQTASLFRLIQDLQKEFPGAAVLGHRDFKGVSKSCPCFDVRTWYTQACMSTEKKEVDPKNEGREKTDRPSMTFRSWLSIISSLWKLYRFIRRRSGG